MTTRDETVQETELTDERGIEEWRIVTLFETISDECSDAPQWEHWRTSPNYTCLIDRSDKWVVQVGRNDPVVSILMKEKGIEASIILQTPVSAISLAFGAARRPEETLLEIAKQYEEDNGIFLHRFDLSDLTPADVIGAKQRQDAWGDRATQPPETDEGDV